MASQVDLARPTEPLTRKGDDQGLADGVRIDREVDGFSRLGGKKNFFAVIEGVRALSSGRPALPDLHLQASLHGTPRVAEIDPYGKRMAQLKEPMEADSGLERNLCGFEKRREEKREGQ